MPWIDTRFGRLEYDESCVVEFPDGLPGFEDERAFVLLDQPAHRPVLFLQSIRQKELCFLTLPVMAVDPDYQPALSEDDERILGLELEMAARADLLWLAILCLAGEDGPTANLLGPLVIDRQSRRGVQAVRVDQVYSARHPIPLEPASCS